MHTDDPITVVRFHLRRLPRLRKTTRAAMVGAILGLLLAACGPAPVGNAVPAGARPSDLSLAACSFKVQGTAFAADCGTLVVPENRANPGSCLISVPVMRVHAAADRPGDWRKAGSAF